MEIKIFPNSFNVIISVSWVIDCLHGGEGKKLNKFKSKSLYCQVLKICYNWTSKFDFHLEI